MVIITEVTVIIMRRLTTTPPRELTAGNRLLTAPTARRRAEPLTIHTQGRTREAPVFRLRMGVEVQRKPITRTPEPMHRRDKVRVRTLSGAAPTCHEGTRVLPWAITRPRMEQ